MDPGPVSVRAAFESGRAARANLNHSDEEYDVVPCQRASASIWAPSLLSSGALLFFWEGSPFCSTDKNRAPFVFHGHWASEPFLVKGSVPVAGRLQQIPTLQCTVALPVQGRHATLVEYEMKMDDRMLLFVAHRNGSLVLFHPVPGTIQNIAEGFAGSGNWSAAIKLLKPKGDTAILVEKDEVTARACAKRFVLVAYPTPIAIVCRSCTLFAQGFCAPCRYAGSSCLDDSRTSAILAIGAFHAHRGRQRDASQDCHVMMGG